MNDPGNVVWFPLADSDIAFQATDAIIHARIYKAALGQLSRLMGPFVPGECGETLRIVLVTRGHFAASMELFRTAHLSTLTPHIISTSQDSTEIPFYMNHVSSLDLDHVIICYRTFFTVEQFVCVTLQELDKAGFAFDLHPIACFCCGLTLAEFTTSKNYVDYSDEQPVIVPHLLAAFHLQRRSACNHAKNTARGYQQCQSQTQPQCLNGDGSQSSKRPAYGEQCSFFSSVF